jgi:hypothetical protein
MGLELEPGRASNGRGEPSVVDLLALQEDVRDVSRKLATLSERFEAHAEQEEDRARRIDATLADLGNKVAQVPTIPSALLANLFGQTAEGAGPTGTGALAASGLVAVISIVLPRVLAWWSTRSRTP